MSGADPPNANKWRGRWRVSQRPVVTGATCRVKRSSGYNFGRVTGGRSVSTLASELMCVLARVFARSVKEPNYEPVPLNIELSERCGCWIGVKARSCQRDVVGQSWRAVDNRAVRTRLCGWPRGESMARQRVRVNAR